MNILQVNMSLDSVSGGGTVERTVQLAKAIERLDGHEVKVLSTDMGLENRSPPLPAEKLLLLHCLLNRWFLPAPNFSKVYHAVLWADVVHLMNHWTLLNAWVYILAKWLGKPYVVCPAGALEIFGRSSILKKIYNFIVGNSLIRNADALIAITEAEVDLFRKSGIPKERIHLIPNGVNAGDFDCSDTTLFRQRFELGHKPYLLFVGRLNEIKGPDILIRAFASISEKFAEHHLVMVGPDGGMKGQLETLIAEYGLKERVHLIGYVGGQMKSSAYHGAELLIIPSRQEAMSIVALEAGISGTPVVMTDRCGLESFAAAGGGITVPLDDEQMGTSVIELLSSAERVAQMGLAARQYVKENFAWRVAAEKYRVVYGGISKGE